MNDNIIPCSDIMMQVVNFAQSGSNNQIHSVWKDVVSKIHSYKDESENNEKRIPIGQRLAGNTRVIDLKNGVLLVETDHPGWIQYLNMYKKFIIKGLKMKLPDIKISSLAFRVSGSNASLCDSYDDIVSKAKKEMAEKIEKDEKKLNECYSGKKENNYSNNCQLPPELVAKFESIKNDMLTNSKN